MTLMTLFSMFAWFYVLKNGLKFLKKIFLSWKHFCTVRRRGHGCEMVGVRLACDVCVFSWRTVGQASRDYRRPHYWDRLCPHYRDKVTLMTLTRSQYDVAMWLGRVTMEMLWPLQPALHSLVNYSYLGWLFGVAVTLWSRSTQLLYVEPG